MKMITKDGIEIEVKQQDIPYERPVEFYERETDGGQHLGMLMESRRRDLNYGTKAVAVTKPGLQLTGKGNSFELKALNPAGRQILEIAAERFSADGVEIRCLEDMIQGRISRSGAQLPEHLRIKQPGLGSVIREVLSIFHVKDEDAGFYGAFAYDYVRQVEEIGTRFAGHEGSDVNLLLPLELVVFDEIRQQATRKTYRFGNVQTGPTQSRLSFGNYAGESSADLTDDQYLKAVEKIISEIAAGEMIQVVMSRAEKLGLIEHPFESYRRLAEVNPSPYGFFYNMGNDEALFGASPEMHIKVSGGNVEIRPLAGTRRRTGNAVDDHYMRQELLTDPKEIGEHIMLVDLARNDLSRIGTNVRVSEFMELVEFPNLYHIGSRVTGRIRSGLDSLDAILSTLPQGTLSGAPKVRAMQEIELLEGSRRGYYGGCVGMVGFNGDCNMAITIRSVHTRNGYGYARAGAGVVLLSKPGTELAETNLKNENQLKALRGGK